SIRKVTADEHGQHIMELAKGLAGTAGVRDGVGPLAGDPDLWARRFPFAPALTVGRGTGVAQVTLSGGRVLGLPHGTGLQRGPRRDGDEPPRPGRRRRRGRLRRPLPAAPPSPARLARHADRSRGRSRRHLALELLPRGPGRLPRAAVRVLRPGGLAGLVLGR